MRLLIDLLEARDIGVSIDRCGADVLVPEEFLKMPQIHASVVKVRGARVTQLVRADRLCAAR